MELKKDAGDKTRLLHLVHSLGMGGAEMALFHYIKALGKKHYQHYVYCFGHDGPVREKIESLGVPVRLGKKRSSIKNPVRFGIDLIALIRELLDFIRIRRIQFLQSHSDDANRLGIIVGKLSRIPAFPTVHSTMAFVYPTSKKWDLRIYLIKAVNAFIYRSSYKILAVSQEVKEVVMTTYGLKDSKVQVLKNGIVLEDSILKPADVANEFALSGNELKILAVGRLVSLKCYDVLIKAVFEVVSQGIHNVLVLIAGEGEERFRLEELIHELDLTRYIKLLGVRHDVLELMKASDIFVMPSRYEGLSIAMIEAMACGLPIIASDAPGLGGCFTNKQNGLLFTVNDHIALAENIIQLANDKSLRTRLSHQARQCFEREYDMRKNIKSLESLFCNIPS